MFVVVDPFGTAAVFAALTQKMDRDLQKKIAMKAVLIAASILLIFSLIGEPLLKYMAISLPAFRVAGGLLLFVTAFRMIMGIHDPDQLNSEKSTYKDRSNIAVFPLAIPLLAGPGCMTAIVMLATSTKSMGEYAQVMGAMGVVMVVALVCLFCAAFLGRLFGPTGYGIITRVMGILLSAMSVQFISDGLHQLFNL
jgi:multiple antibiotic resistance protein